MRIDRLQLTNWMNHRHADLALSPLTVVAGGNDRGKSAIRDAVLFALLGETPRITLKADRPMLITDGESRGSVTIHAGEWSVARNVKDGKAKAAGEGPPLGDGVTREVFVDVAGYCLNPHLWAEADTTARREALMAAMAVQVTPARVKAAMGERGVLPGVLALLPDDKLGEWEKLAERGAAEARGAWRHIAGEAYGEKKAAEWEPPPIEGQLVDDEQMQALAHAAETSAEAVRTARQALTNAEIAERVAGANLGAMQAEQATLAQDLAAAEAAEAAATTTHETAGQTSREVEARRALPALTCPHCAGAVQLHSTGRSLVVYRPPAQPATPAEVDAASKGLAAAHRALEDAMVQVSTTRRMLAATEARIASHLADAAKAQDGPSREQAQAALQQAEEAEKANRAAFTAAKSTAEQAAGRLRRQSDARAQHEAVLAWTQVRDLVSPNGIPGELLAKALKPFNSTLRAFAEQTGWPQVAIRDDMTITSDGRLYSLCAHSRQWRADLMIAVALAVHSGLRMVLADEADVLEVDDRDVLLSWLYDLVGDSLDTAIVFATLQRPPSGPDDVTVHWLGSNLTAENVAA